MLKKTAMLTQRTCCCIPVETATLIFGVISAVISAIGVLGFGLSRFWYPAMVDDEDFLRWNRDPDSMRADARDEKLQFKMLLYTVGVLMLLLFFFCSIISFIFSVFLCYGTHKKRAGFVKAYFIYGVVLVVLLLAASVAFPTYMGGFVYGPIVLIICGFQSLVLMMVHRTHENILAEKTRKSAELLGPAYIKF